MQETINLGNELQIHYKDKKSISNMWKIDIAHIWITDMNKSAPKRKIDFMFRITKKGSVLKFDLTKTEKN